jgi:hypothetical protein
LLELISIGSIQFGVIAGLDPAIHPLRKMLYAKVTVRSARHRIKSIGTLSNNDDCSHRGRRARPRATQSLQIETGYRRIRR